MAMIVHFSARDGHPLRRQGKVLHGKRYFLPAVVNATVFTPLCHHLKFDVNPATDPRLLWARLIRVGSTSLRSPRTLREDKESHCGHPQTAGVMPEKEFKRGLRLWHCAHRKDADILMVSLLHHRGIQGVSFLSVIGLGWVCACRTCLWYVTTVLGMWSDVGCVVTFMAGRYLWCQCLQPCRSSLPPCGRTLVP